jgi:hypothetical protein
MRRASEYPSLIGSPAESRVFRFGIDDMLDCLAHETCSTCDKDDCSHRSGVELLHIYKLEPDLTTV